MFAHGVAILILVLLFSINEMWHVLDTGLQYLLILDHSQYLFQCIQGRIWRVAHRARAPPNFFQIKFFYYKGA